MPVIVSSAWVLVGSVWCQWQLRSLCRCTLLSPLVLVGLRWNRHRGAAQLGVGILPGNGGVQVGGIVIVLMAWEWEPSSAWGCPYGPVVFSKDGGDMRSKLIDMRL